MTEAPDVEFSAADTNEAFAGHRTAQLVLLFVAVAAALAAGVSTSRLFGSAIVGVIVGVGGAVMFAALAWMPIYSGQTADQALSRAVRAVWWAIRGRRRHTSRLPTVGATADGFTAQQLVDSAPPEFDGIEFLQAMTPSQRLVCVLYDRMSDAYSAVMQIRPPAAAALDGELFAQMMRSWDQLLAAAVSPFVRRLQVVQVSCPDDDGTDLHRYYAERSIDGGGEHAHRNYRELIAGAGPASMRHEGYLAVQIGGGHVAARTRAGRKRRATRHAAVCEKLLTEMGRISELAGRVGVHVVNPMLSPRELATVWRTMYFPDDRVDVARRDDRVDGDEQGVSWQGAFPRESVDHADHYDVDGIAHAAWWVEGWPARAHGRFLEPVLLGPASARAFAVVLEPLSAAVERQRAGERRMKTQVDAADRDKRGFITTTARADRDEQVAQYDRDVHDGWAPFRFAGYITVSAASVDGLAIAIEEIRDAASDAGLEIRRARQVHRQVHAFAMPGMVRGVGSHRGRPALQSGR